MPPKLVGGFDPSEKHARPIGSFPPNFRDENSSQKNIDKNDQENSQIVVFVPLINNLSITTSLQLSTRLQNFEPGLESHEAFAIENDVRIFD